MFINFLEILFTEFYILNEEYAPDGYVVATDKFGGKSIKTTPNSPVERLQSLPDISDINPLKYKSIQNMRNTPNS